MAVETITFDDVLQLARRLSPADQARLREALAPAVDADLERALQRQKNQAAIDLLDSWLAEATLEPSADDDDDSWWEDFVTDIDAYRISSRPLFPDRTSER